MTIKRLFVAIDPPASLKASLAELDPGVPGAHWISSEQMHLTLGFFGNVARDTELSLREKLSAIRFRSFFLPFTHVGTFPPAGSPKVIWIGIGTGHPHLFQIHKRVQEAALAVGLEPDLRPWHPHLTLARCFDVSPQSIAKFLKRNAEFDAGMIRVEDFRVYSSKLTPVGPVYQRELIVPAVG